MRSGSVLRVQLGAMSPLRTSRRQKRLVRNFEFPAARTDARVGVNLREFVHKTQT